MYPPNTPPQYIEGTPEYAAREEAQKQWLEEQKALKAEREREKEAEIQAAEEKRIQALATIERKKEEFKARAASYRNMEEVFASQAQLLHGMFTHAVDEYVGACVEENKAKIYSAIALRAQNYCRMTLGTMARMKECIFNATIACEKKKIEDPAIQEAQHAQMDSGVASQAGGIDASVAAVENSCPQNP